MEQDLNRRRWKGQELQTGFTLFTFMGDPFMKVILSTIASTFFLCAVGCAQTTPIGTNSSILWWSGKQESQLIRSLGYEDYISFAKRDSTGDHLFIQFSNSNDLYRVAIVSANDIKVKDLPGQSCLNDDGNASFWLNNSLKTIEFANGTILPTNSSTINFISDGKFVAMFNPEHEWVASVEAPLRQLVLIPRGNQIEKIASERDKLYLFEKGQPEAKPRPDHWEILKCYEYGLDRDGAKLLRIQDFDFTWQVYDFDPVAEVMLVRSWNDMFPHGIMVDLHTGKQKRVSLAGDPFFLKDGVIRKIKSLSTLGRP